MLVVFIGDGKQHIGAILIHVFLKGQQIFLH